MNRRIIPLLVGCALCVTIAAPLETAAIDTVQSRRTITIKTPNVPLSELPVTVLDDSTADKGYVSVLTPADGHLYRLYISNPNGSSRALTLPDDQSDFLVNLGPDDGDYQLRLIMMNDDGETYTQLQKKVVRVEVRNQVAQALYPTIMADYAHNPDTVEAAAELAAGLSHDGKVRAVFDYVSRTMSYDHELAETAAPLYVLRTDETLASKTGICWDYASLAATMLRSQGVPCRVIIGTYDGRMHAWCQVYDQSGRWILMDPTFGYLQGQVEPDDVDPSAYVTRQLF